MKRVLIIGGYGNFGRFITERLAREVNISIIVAGRSIAKAQQLAETIQGANPVDAAVLDIDSDFSKALEAIMPDVVIHTSGPFQEQGYQVAEACIARGAHYIDLADGRDFVTGIDSLNSQAAHAGVLVVSGASSVPCLTSALVDHYQAEFKTLESLDYGITTAQKTTRGLATTAAILSYTGKPFATIVDGKRKSIFGWQDLHGRRYQGLGWRLLGNCNIPDLDLFQKRYPGLKTIRFYAGLELPFIHVTLWGLSWLVRAGMIRGLEPLAPVLLKLSFLFDRLGSADSGFHMVMSGTDTQGIDKTITFELTAREGDGPYIPCMPAVILTRKLVNGELTRIGAMPCLGLISLSEYLTALEELNISWNQY